MNKLFALFFLFNASVLAAQEYSDYLGAGNSNGITVSSSSSQNRTGWFESASGDNTINGSGLDSRLLETSRFLSQATFGTKLEYIKAVSLNSFEEWIDTQYTINSPSIGALTNTIYNQALNMFIANGGDPEDYFGPHSIHFQYAWWESNIGNEDLLRQKIALALSEILVISWDSNLDSYGVGLGNYYDVLKDNAFGNFRDILLNVTLHPMMGAYLSHYNNPRSFINENIHPDENYAREVMQLFSIGLYELSQDGTYILDNNGDRIPTYDNNDIKEFAKVFTGLGPAEVIPNEYNVQAQFGTGFYFAKKDVPMIMYDQWHEPGPKNLLNNFTIPSGQTGMQDIEATVDHLFNHQNVAPFIAKRLIQNLVKSNPTAQYISRVSAVFNNTNGVRGDMQAVIKAILLDDEARSCTWINSPDQGKLIEPMMRYFNVTRQIDLDNQNGQHWNIGYSFYNASSQAPLAAPHVFNFFSPNYVPNTEFADENLVGPEFKIHNSATSIAYVNEVDLWTTPQYFSVLNTWDLELEGTPLDFEKLKYYAKDPEVLINELDKLFTRGLLSDSTRQLIMDAVEPLAGNNSNIDYMYYRVKMAVYLILISPDYAILK